MSAGTPYTGKSAFESLSPASPAPSGAPATPSEPGVLLVLKSGARIFVPRPTGGISAWEDHFIGWLEGNDATPLLVKRYLDRREVAYAEITTEAKAEKAPAGVAAAVAEAVAAAAKATVAAEDANAAADEVLGSVDGDVSDWTDEQIRDTIGSLRHKVDNKVIGPDETAQALTDAMLEVVRLEGVLGARRATATPTAFGTIVPPVVAS